MKKVSIFVDERICKGCDLCVFYCPKDVLKLADTMNQKGYNVAKVIHPENCTGCRLCESGCPDLAIFIREDQPPSA